LKSGAEGFLTGKPSGIFFCPILSHIASWPHPPIFTPFPKTYRDTKGKFFNHRAVLFVIYLTARLGTDEHFYEPLRDVLTGRYLRNIHLQALIFFLLLAKHKMT